MTEKKMKLIFLILTVSIILLLCLSIFLPMMINPVRRPASSLRNWILQQVEVGSSLDEVFVFLDDMEWKRPSELSDVPLVIRYSRPRIPFSMEHIQEEDVIIGTQAMRTSIPTYISPLPLPIGIPMGAHVYWAFCESGYLVDIRVIKEQRMF